MKIYQNKKYEKLSGWKKSQTETPSSPYTLLEVLFVDKLLSLDIEIFKWLEVQQNLCKTTTLKRPKIGFQDQLSLNAGQKYCRMLQWEHARRGAFCNTFDNAGQKYCRIIQGEHSAILSTFIKLQFVFNIFVLSILSGRSTQFYCTRRYISANIA